MVTSSKILTVSYGTFSCTLEGFDDPFTTLQMVAEYFRKLAAEDRFFGGTPQMPDTEKLKQIARNATSRAVDAEVGESGIVLRQSANQSANQPATIEETTLTDDAEATPFRSRRPASQTTETAPRTEIQRPEKTSVKPATRQSVEATLAAIRQNVEKAGSGTALVDRDTSDDDADDNDDFNLTAEAATGADDSADDTAGGSLFEPHAKEVEEAPEPEAPLVLETPAEAEGEAVSEDAPEAVEETVTETVDEPTVEATSVEETPEVAAEAPAEADNTGLDGIRAALAAQASTHVVKSQKSAAEIEAEFDAEFEQAFATPVREPAPAAVTEPEPVAEIPEEVVAPEPTPEPVAEHIEEPEVAAVEVPSVRDALAKPENSILSDEEEEELVRDLEAAVAVEDNTQPVIDVEAATRREERRLRAEALRANDDLEREEKALDRLLETTQSKMERPDQKRRLNALDQLKAAVAATEAEKAIKKKRVAKGHDEEELDEHTADLAAYREDLRRAQSRARESGRSGLSGLRQAPPPLILVSEQRIANPAQSEPQSPAEPRREVAESAGNLALKTAPEPEAEDHRDHHRAEGEIRGIPADAFKDSTSFADFAERIGAVDMVELLEAAAAYTSIIEGQAEFSRAQAMSKIAKIAPDDTFSKEAGLRAFGKLLREGKILRVQDGQFAISKSSRFSIASRFES